ncbi:hypothetical protein [Halorhabdus amylolytica]|uniref:hypothetical protein n=1 Tax=Halorhabdus amylolytica TaxID=2559573 RepID=UPI0010AAE722|nr:hypothetical protein [Halorhabdus amylolytica]
MQVRDWVQDYFGESANSLLDEGVYSDEDLRRDKIKLRKQRNRIEEEMNQYSSEYKELLQKGAQANELKRETYAKKAQIAKKKYKLKKKQYQKNSVILGTVVSVEGARELQDMHDGDSTEIESLISERDIDVESVQEDMMNQMVEFDLDMELMQEVQDGLDIDIMTSDIGTEDSEEMEMMEEMAAGKITEEEIEVEETVETGSVEDVTLEDDLEEIDIEDEEIEI